MEYKKAFLLKEPEYENILVKYLRSLGGIVEKEFLNKEGNLFYIDPETNFVVKINEDSCNHTFKAIQKVDRYHVLFKGSYKCGNKLISYLERKGGINKNDLNGEDYSYYYYIDNVDGIIKIVFDSVVNMEFRSQQSFLTSKIDIPFPQRYPYNSIIFDSDDPSFYDEKTYVEGQFINNKTNRSYKQKYDFIKNPKYDIKVGDIVKIRNNEGKIFDNLFKITSINKSIPYEEYGVKYYMIDPFEIKKDGELIPINKLNKSYNISIIDDGDISSLNNSLTGIRLRLSGFEQKDENTIICPDGNEMNLEDFILSFKVIAKESIRSDNNKFARFIEGESINFRFVTQKYGEQMICPDTVCDNLGNIYIYLDLTKPNNGYSTYIGVDPHSIVNIDITKLFDITWKPSDEDFLFIKNKKNEISISLDGNSDIVAMPLNYIKSDISDICIDESKLNIGKIINPENKEIENTKIVNNNKNKKEMKSNKMMASLLNKFKATYVPQKEENVKISMNGAVCIPVNGEYVGIDTNNNLVSYPAEMCMECPVYTIAKPVAQVQVGDIIKRGNSYAKVIEKKENTLRCLSYSGYIQNKKEVTDFLMNQAMERVVLNMFTMTGNNMNPMMFALMNEDEDSNFDMKSLLMMQMMQQGNQGNAQGGMAMNPMMLMCMAGNEEGGSNSMMEMMMLSQMMGGQNNPFGGMFGNVPSNGNTTPNA